MGMKMFVCWDLYDGWHKGQFRE
ncbi:hypothetical protein RDI58_015759 [Solanum bulbocastanum]|uniref:Uncharacterized protein n=1 Tax=Solanum bulbocastanum TaxID=147425 RepID=A0AAN8TID3_SOLBU